MIGTPPPAGPMKWGVETLYIHGSRPSHPSTYWLVCEGSNWQRWRNIDSKCPERRDTHETGFGWSLVGVPPACVGAHAAASPLAAAQALDSRGIPGRAANPNRRGLRNNNNNDNNTHV